MSYRTHACRCETYFAAGLLVGSLSMFAAVLGWFFVWGVRGGWR